MIERKSRAEDGGLVLSGFSVYRHGVPLLHDINLAMDRGTRVAVVGSNGSGKSALVAGLAGLLPHGGTVRLHGVALQIRDPISALRAGIALCPADRGIFPRLTVEENLLVGGHLLPRRQRRTRAAEMLARFHDLGRRAATRAGQLSGGERQQLAIARALMVQPQVLLLDEPSRGLSPASLMGLLDILQEEAKRGTIALVVDQALDWLEGRVDRLIVVADGRIGADLLPTDAAVGKVAAAYFDLGNNAVETKS